MVIQANMVSAPGRSHCFTDHEIYQMLHSCSALLLCVEFLSKCVTSWQTLRVCQVTVTDSLQWVMQKLRGWRLLRPEMINILRVRAITSEELTTDSSPVSSASSRAGCCSMTLPKSVSPRSGVAYQEKASYKQYNCRSCNSFLKPICGQLKWWRPQSKSIHHYFLFASFL